MNTFTTITQLSSRLELSEEVIKHYLNSFIADNVFKIETDYKKKYCKDKKEFVLEVNEISFAKRVGLYDEKDWLESNMCPKRKDKQHEISRLCIHCKQPF